MTTPRPTAANHESPGRGAQHRPGRGDLSFATFLRALVVAALVWVCGSYGSGCWYSCWRRSWLWRSTPRFAGSRRATSVADMAHR